MDGMGVYRWSNGRCAPDVAASFRFQQPPAVLPPTLPTPFSSIFKGQWKENNMHGCGKKWYPGGAIEEVGTSAAT